MVVMSDYFDAFDVSPISVRGSRAVSPGIFRGIYAMPTFVTIPTRDLERSTNFWVRGLGFIELFSTPGQVVHLRRWAFQDVLLVPADAEAADPDVPALSAGFSCLLDEIDILADACTALAPDSVTGPYDTPWGTRDITVITPERARVVYTAPRDIVPGGEIEHNLAANGITVPSEAIGDDNVRDE